MKIVAYRITLLEPVIVTSLAGDPNSAISHDYLPGSVLRGVFIGLEKRQAKWKDDTLLDPTVRRRFFEATTRFLNGYLIINNVRSLPAPQTWQKNKYPSNEAETSEIKDLAFAKELAEKAIQLKESGTPQEKTKSLGGNFIVYDHDPASTTQKVYVAKPPHVINVHTERGRERGRSTKGDGAIYRYDALEAGQTFEAQILCDDDSDAEYFFDLIKSSAAPVIGGARSAGYGRVKFHEPKFIETGREIGGKEIAAPSDSLVLTLLSDTILRDKHGQYSPDTDTLKKALEARLEREVKFKDVFKNESVVGGFNRKWGLPLPQVQAIALGSVFVLELDLTKLSAAEKAQLSDNLKSLEWRGLGERRMDGFGRVAVGWQQSQKLEEKEPESQISENADQTDESLTEEVNLVRKRLEKRLGQQQTDREQLVEANKLKLSKKLPPASQLNRLRQQITAALLQPESDTTSVIRFLQNIEGKRADKHFERARVDNLEMRQWLRNQAGKPDKYAALRLIDGMLANAAKQSREQQDQQRGSGNE